MESGELVHVGPDLSVTSTVPLPKAPSHRLTLADLEPTAAASQQLDRRFGGPHLTRETHDGDLPPSCVSPPMRLVRYVSQRLVPLPS